MKENSQMINDPRKRKQIFHSLMQVRFHTRDIKTRDELLTELAQAELDGKLRLYRPEDTYVRLSH